MSEAGQTQHGKGPVTSDEEALKLIREQMTETGSLPSVRQLADKITTSPNRASALIKQAVKEAGAATSLTFVDGVPNEAKSSLVNFVAEITFAATQGLNKDLVQAQDDLEQSRLQIAEREQSLREATEELNKAREDLMDARANSESHQEAFKAQQAEKEAQANQLADAQTKLSAANEELQRLLSQAASRIEELSSTKSAHKDEIAQLKAKHSETLDEQKTESATLLAEARAQLESESTKLAESVEVIEDLNQRVMSLSGDVKFYTDELAAADTAHDETKKKLKKTSDALTAEKSQHTLAKDKLDKSVEALEACKKNLEDAQANAANYQALQAVIDRLESAIASQAQGGTGASSRKK